MSPARGAPDLSALTGIRSAKSTYYRDYLRSDARMHKAIHAIDTISRALVRTVEGPRGLLEEVARAAADHLDATWSLLVLADGRLLGARPRFVALDGERLSSTLPTDVLVELDAARKGRARPALEGGWVRVPVELEGEVVGVLSCLHGLGAEPHADDLAVLRTLANQAAVSLHTSQQYQAGLALNRRAERLLEETAAQAQDLDERTDELHRAEGRLALARERLVIAQERELLDTERHRIARELHDSVTQVVLAAGMAVEVARGEASLLGEQGEALADQLVTVKTLAQRAVEQLRTAIYALHQEHREGQSTLPELVAEMLAHHERHLDTRLDVRGAVVALPGDVQHEITRAVAEALFNVAAHAGASRVLVGLRYGGGQLRISVDDDGAGDPRVLARRLWLEGSTATDGRHRGLVNIDTRIRELGGSIAFRRSRLGGLRLGMRVPLTSSAGAEPGLVESLAAPLRRPSSLSTAARSPLSLPSPDGERP